MARPTWSAPPENKPVFVSPTKVREGLAPVPVSNEELLQSLFNKEVPPGVDPS